MDVASFCRQSRVLVVAGKGGVGKTTVTAALAAMACHAGLSVLVVDLEGRSGLPAAFGRSGSLDYEATLLAEGSGSVRARRITPDDALLEYLADHGMKRISKRLVSSGALDVVATAIPGIRDILVLGKVKSLEVGNVADWILVDAPATGHAMTFLSSARGLLDAARAGPVRTQAADVVELLTDASRCQVALVTLPEEMPINEVIEAAYALEDRIGVTLSSVVVNGCLPEEPELLQRPQDAAAEVGVELSPEEAAALARAAEFECHRVGLQGEQLQRLADELPLPQLRARYLFDETVGPDQLALLTADLTAGVEALPGPARRAGSPRPSAGAER
ncbi:MAG TPA: ArsA-related P-loop ATPase [Acidimicrobiales bacterium]|nr:ArsA-related P-loop ATPase [Acidimicrobiales bacterium]